MPTSHLVPWFLYQTVKLGFFVTYEPLPLYSEAIFNARLKTMVSDNFQYVSMNIGAQLQAHVHHFPNIFRPNDLPAIAGPATS
jgi:hypothetical protein